MSILLILFISLFICVLPAVIYNRITLNCISLPPSLYSVMKNNVNNKKKILKGAVASHYRFNSLQLSSLSLSPAPNHNLLYLNALNGVVSRPCSSTGRPPQRFTQWASTLKQAFFLFKGSRSGLRVGGHLPSSLDLERESDRDQLHIRSYSNTVRLVAIKTVIIAISTGIMVLSIRTAMVDSGCSVHLRHSWVLWNCLRVQVKDVEKLGVA